MNLRASALAIFQAALNAADPRRAVSRTLERTGDRLRVGSREYPLSRVFVVGFGKASAAMAQAVEQILGDKIAGGWVSVKYGHRASFVSDKIHLHEAGHPLPDANSIAGAERILALLEQAAADDLVLCLISGGGSAILELPVPGVTLEDLRVTTEALLRSGATINAINTVRKHLSQVKGGQLARHTRAPIVSLILSDVIGSPLDTIASGPTAPDPTTFADVIAVIEQRGIRPQFPAGVIEHIERGARGEFTDTPKTTDPALARVQNIIIADNAIACAAAASTAAEHGFQTLLLSTFVQGEAREVARVLAAVAKEIAATGVPVGRPGCIIAGGETTVTVRGQGRGGRNQELALAAAMEIAGLENAAILSAGTDGSDGPTDAAGAIADGSTLERAAARGLDARQYLYDNDAYHFFAPLGDLIVTGPTHTNENDVMLVLVA